MTVPLMLIHGGVEGAWVWDEVRADVKAPTVTVDLAGRDGRPSDFPDITLQRWVGDVESVLDREGIDHAVLVAHSLGGVTATEFAATHPERVAALVYVSAIVPPDGQSMATALAGEHAETLFSDDGGFWPDSDEAMTQALFNGDTELAAPALPRLVPESAGPLRTPVRTGSVPEVPIWYVRLGADHGLAPVMQDQMIGHLPRPVTVIKIPGACHMIMSADPAKLAGILDEIAAQVDSWRREPATAP